MRTPWPTLPVALTIAAACATVGAQAPPPEPPRVERRSEKDTVRADLMARAQVRRPTAVRSMNLLLGPRVPGSFEPRAALRCQYVDKRLDGNSPKFVCRVGPHDDVKVKYGGNNGEVYGELLATRLLWALGFGADAMYTVNVVCQGCPDDLGGIARPGGESRFDPAVIERKMAGDEWPPDGRGGWSWQDLDRTAAGGAPRAHRDALKLLAVFMQHSDSKPQQQRIVCLGGIGRSGTCNRPFLMVSDVGLTFGAASRANSNDLTGVNLERWRDTPVWKGPTGCVGNLEKSLTGTLENPEISEAGRRFLANLLVQLSDRQVRDLFEAARVNLRLRSPGQVFSGFATADEWVRAFKAKRAEIVSRRCGTGQSLAPGGTSPKASGRKLARPS